MCDRKHNGRQWCNSLFAPLLSSLLGHGGRSLGHGVGGRLLALFLGQRRSLLPQPLGRHQLGVLLLHAGVRVQLQEGAHVAERVPLGHRLPDLAIGSAEGLNRRTKGS